MAHFDSLTLTEWGEDVWTPTRTVPAPGVVVQPMGGWEDVPSERYLDGYVPSRRLVALSAPDGACCQAWQWRLWHGGPASGFEYRTLTPMD